MRNFTHILFSLFCLTALPACAQIKYPAKITVRVVDDAGTPITAGIVRASVFSKWVRGEGFGYDEHENFDTSLNQEGVAEINVLSPRKDFGYWPIVDEKCYYSGGGGRYRFKQVLNGRWEPWNPEIKIVVPRILNPIPLYARQYGLHERVTIPAEKAVGFDLMVSDWVAPYGKGKRADFVFDYKTIVPLVDETRAFECTLTLTFSNPGDGIQSRLAPTKRRLLELPRQAPEEGYGSKWTKRFGRPAVGADLLPFEHEDQNFFFRVRTVLDPSGKVVSAYYGKIHGDIIFDAIRHLRFTYYLNSTANDRNLEFDPKRNLLTDKLSGTDVVEP